MQKKGKHQKNNKIAKIIFIIIFILSVLYICFRIFSNKTDGNEILDSIDVDDSQKTEEISERMLQIQDLKKENNEIIGWLEIQNTDINFPVLQGTDNEYYMKHTYKKEYSNDGSIFLDKDYNWNLPSSNLLLYGHNNKNGNMFQNLLKYKEESYYKEHPNIKFTTLDNDSEYEIISVFLSRVYYKDEKDVFRYYYFINANNEEEYNYYINESKKASLYNIEKTAKYGDQLLTLSTCEYSQEDGRFVIVAKKSK